MGLMSMHPVEHSRLTECHPSAVLLDLIILLDKEDGVLWRPVLCSRIEQAQAGGTPLFAAAALLPALLVGHMSMRGVCIESRW